MNFSTLTCEGDQLCVDVRSVGWQSLVSMVLLSDHIVALLEFSALGFDSHHFDFCLFKTGVVIGWSDVVDCSDVVLGEVCFERHPEGAIVLVTIVVEFGL